MTLPLDKTRCLDTDCPQARTCARWVHRNDPAPLQSSLREGERCGAFIEERKEEE